MFGELERKQKACSFTDFCFILSFFIKGYNFKNEHGTFAFYCLHCILFQSKHFYF